MKNNRWKKMISGILAVCLVAALLLSNQSLEVFAEEGETQENTAEMQTEEAVNADNTTETKTVEETDKNTEENVSVFSGTAQSYAWKQEANNISIEGNGADPGTITVTTGTKESLYTGDKVVAFDYNISSENTTTDELSVTISDCGIMSDDTSLEIWHVEGNAIEKIASNLQISEGKVQFATNKLGEFVAVSNVVTVDLAKSTEKTSIKVSNTTTINKTGVSISYDSLKGCRQDGTSITVNFSSDGAKKYRVSQSENKRISHSIWFSGAFTTNRNIIIDDINTTGSIDIAAGTYQKLVSLQLRGENQLHHIGYGCGSDNHNSKLVIENYGMASDTSGKLYIPYKMSDKTEEQNYIFQTGGSNYWAYAGIGGNQEVGSNMRGLTIAGGTIRVITQNKDGSTAIGAGGNGDAQLNITGGDITAICSSTGTAIGGGIGWLYRGGTADISITGGTVYAENVKYRSATANVPNGVSLGNIEFGGVAIGSGSSVVNVGNPATIYIAGNSRVTAYARYGNGIGSGNSYNGTAATADITIAETSEVTTNALGGGTSKTGQGGSANITVKDNATVNCVKYSQIEDKWDQETNNILGAFGIGGGNSAGDAKGGNAVVNVSGGSLNCNGGNIGGGNANDTGAGGDASIYVSGGILDCASIGGGNSTNGTPGAVTSSTQSAGVVVTGGTLKAGTIGGGKNTKGDIGFATADISGGKIQGQFILSNTDTSRQCKFTMTGGTIDNQFLGTENYQMAQKNGGAVYLSDPSGEVSISGGTIQNCKAEQGGAVYMTNGTFELSGTGIIDNCVATGNSDDAAEKLGGALYLDNGTVFVSGGSIKNSSADKGGAIYLKRGAVTVSGGSVGTKDNPNKATQGAGVYMEDGNLNVSGGTIAYNEATSLGGGAYLSGGKLELSAGNISNNNATNGGGAYLANGQLNVSGGKIESNIVAENGGGFYLAGGQLYITDGTMKTNIAKNGAGAYVADSTVRMFGGTIDGNTASENGGGMYVSSEKQAADVVIRSGSLINNVAGNSKTATSQNGNGGAIAVVNSNGNGNKDQVIIGVREVHTGLSILDRSFTSFPYNDDKDIKDGTAVTHNHASCPVISGNTASGDGGGIYMNSSASVVDIYCLTEDNNTSLKDANGGSIMSEGGNVNIGDKDENGEENNTENAAGNVYIQSRMLVKGGNVTLCGNTENPRFKGEILVDIEKTTTGTKGTFTDNRYAKITGNYDYKVHYYENWEDGSGTFMSVTYGSTGDITLVGNMFTHTGYTILGWNTQADGKGTTYNTGTNLDRELWSAQDASHVFKLYAIWKPISYTVKYDANASGYSGTEMADEQFSYGVQKKLSANTYKVTGMRFKNWNTDPKGEKDTYPANYDASKMSTTGGSTITLYAQWIACTHKETDGATLSYTADQTNKTITESCDCGGHTSTVTLSAADVYYDQKSHPADVKRSGAEFVAEISSVTYQYKESKTDTYGNLKAGETEPTSIGFYQASIAVGGKTVSVEYEIKSAAEAITIDVNAKQGQHFDSFNGTTCTVAQDDAFTVQFNVQGLDKSVNENKQWFYTTVPVLTLDRMLPAGTTIIMQTDNSYWYLNSPTGKKIALTSFIKMGTTDTYFPYYKDTSIPSNQMYRFIIDFSDVSENYLESNLKVGLKYAYTVPGSGSTSTDNDKSNDISVTIDEKADFRVNLNNNVYTVTAPASITNTRWAQKNLVWKIVPKDGTEKIPADAKLTVSTSGSSGVRQVSQNVNGAFIVPFNWSGSQDVTFTLVSAQEAKTGSVYKFIAYLCVGSKTDDTMQPAAQEDSLQKVSQELNLSIPVKELMSLKISGISKDGAQAVPERVLTTSDGLNVNINYENIPENYYIQAVIQKKKGDVYQGEFYKGTDIKAEDQAISLGGINTTAGGAGCYRLLVTVSASEDNSQTLLEVPYYFIVQ